MSLFLRLGTLYFLILLTTGCSHLIVPGENLTDEVNALIAQEKYGRALAAINRVQPSSTQYKQGKSLKKVVLKKASAYETKLIREAKQQQQQEQWGKAESILKKGISNYPQGKKLQQALEQHISDREKRRHELDVKLMLSRGTWLHKEIGLRQDRLKTSPNDPVEKFKLSRMESEATTLSEKLRMEGINATNKGDLNIASKLLSLANDLHKTPKTDQAIKQLQQRIKSQKRRKQHVLERKQARENQKLIDQFENALNQGELQQARKLLSQLEKGNLESEQLSSLQQKLAHEIADTVEKLIQKGNRYYSQSNYALAIQYWEKAKLLNPDDTRLDSQIERAKRIITNLEQIRKQEQ